MSLISGASGYLSDGPDGVSGVVIVNDGSASIDKTSAATNPNVMFYNKEVFYNGTVKSATYAWLTGGIPSNFELRATLISGNAYGTYGVWNSPGEDFNHIYELNNTGVAETSDVLFEIRNKTTQVIIDSGTVTLSITSTGK